MELSFQRTCLEQYEPVVDTVLSQEVTAESIVPDAFPDVFGVVCTFGNACIASKQIHAHSVKIAGIVQLHVLYIPEGGTAPRSLFLELPFQSSSDFPRISERDAVHASALSVSAQARLLNPRKLFVKAEVRLRLLCCAPKQIEVISEPAQPDPSIQILKSEHSYCSIPSVTEKPFSFTETLRQGQTKPAIEELLTYRMDEAGIEARYIGDKLICKGILLLSGLYRSGSELFPLQFELPFSQILELEGSLEQGDPDIIFTLRNASCVLRDGELDVSVDALIQAVVWSGKNVTMLSDLYSTSGQLDVERKTIPLCTHMERGTSRVAVRKFFESGTPAKQVLMTHVDLKPLICEKTDRAARYSTDAALDILYLSEEDDLYCASYVLPVSCEVEVPSGHTCTCLCHPAGEVSAVPVTGGMEVRLEVDFNRMLTEQKSLPCVFSAKSGTPAPSDGKLPSVMIRMVSEGESLWDVAKACRSTVQDIRAANGLTSETVQNGTVLLVPTKRD